MSVSSESSCSSAAYIEAGNPGSLKLKRRWIEMNSADVELQETNDPSAKLPRHSVIRGPLRQVQEARVIRADVNLPEDPRDWTKRDVRMWLKYMAVVYDLDISTEKFDMNGKALCMMTMGMFVDRIPIGGKFLFKDFRIRLCKAVFLQNQRRMDNAKLTHLHMLVYLARKSVL